MTTLAPSRLQVRAISAYAARRADLAFEIHGKLLHLSPQLCLGDIAEAGGVLADVWGRSDGLLVPSASASKFRPLVAAVVLQIEDRDAFVVGRSLQDIRMA